MHLRSFAGRGSRASGLGADGVTVQCVDDRITALFIFLVAGWQEDDDIAIGSIAFEIAFESRAVNLDVLNCGVLCTGNGFGNVGLHLRRKL